MRNLSTVKLDFKNRQDKNQLDFKNQIINDQLDQFSFKNCQDKNILTLRTIMTVNKYVLKTKFNYLSVNCFSLFPNLNSVSTRALNT